MAQFNYFPHVFCPTASITFVIAATNCNWSHNAIIQSAPFTIPLSLLGALRTCHLDSSVLFTVLTRCAPRNCHFQAVNLGQTVFFPQLLKRGG